MVDRFEYEGYLVAIEPHEDKTKSPPEWHASVYIRLGEEGEIESFSVSPPDLSSTEAMNRGRRVARATIDKKIGGAG